MTYCYCIATRLTLVIFTDYAEYLTIYYTVYSIHCTLYSVQSAVYKYNMHL